MSTWSRKRKRVVEEGEVEEEDEKHSHMKKKHSSGTSEKHETTEQKIERKRRRRLYRRIRDQMEFYFSESNLSKDRYLMDIMNGNAVAWVPLAEFLKFNKIKCLTNNTRDIRKAISHSKVVEISENQQCVRRRSQMQSKENTDMCTVYVEGIPSCADVDWIRHLFGQWGTVCYVSLPRYKSNGKTKGFAFIEFETPDEASKILTVFGEVGCHQNPTEPEASAPMSFVAYEQSDDLRIIDDAREKEVMRKTVVFLQGSDSEAESKRAELLGIEEGEVPEEDGTEEGKKRKKKKRKRRKKEKVDDLELGSLGLKVMTKKEWKVLRNKYLDLQRKNASRLKDHLKTFPTPPRSNADATVPAMPASETAKMRKADSNQGLTWEEREKQEVWRRLNYRAGTIVKVFTEIDSEDSLKIIRNLINAVITPEQIDVQPDQDLCFVRCRTALDAKKLANSPSFTAAQTLTGVEEALYWQELFERKLAKMRRGRSKLAAKADRVLDETEKRIQEETLGIPATPSSAVEPIHVPTTLGSEPTAVVITASPLTPAATSTAGSIGCGVPGLDDLTDSEEEEGALK